MDVSDVSEMIVRRAIPADAAGIAYVHIMAWKTAYRGLLPDHYLDQLTVKRSQRRWQPLLHKKNHGVLVGDLAGRILGFVSAGPTRDEDHDPAQVGEIYAIYLDPAVWGKGYGLVLMNAALAALREAKFSVVSLWVLHDNQRAITFYERCGFSPDGGTKIEQRQDDVIFSEVRYRRLLG